MVFWVLRSYYLRTSRAIKRLEGIARTPLIDHFRSSLCGLPVIRAFKAEEYFKHEFCVKQDVHTSAWLVFVMTARWFALRMELLCTVLIVCVTFLSLLARDRLDPGLVGLSLVYAFSLTNWFQWGVRQSADLENHMISVE